MSVRIQGFEEHVEELERLGDRTPDGERGVALTELFTPDFVGTFSEFESIEQFFEESPWTVETNEDFESIPRCELDDYVDEHTGFSSWDAMLAADGREWLIRQIDS